MIKSIKLKKLFGRFDYSLHFTEDAIIIITGPNGYGKSTILKMINDLCNDQFHALLSVNFGEFEIECDDVSLVVIKNKDSFSINGEEYIYPVARRYRRGIPPYLRRVSPHEYVDIRTNEKIVFDRPYLQMYEEAEGLDTSDKFFYDLLSTLMWEVRDGVDYDKIKKTVSQVNEIKNQIGKVRFIREQRLIAIKNAADEDYSGVQSEKAVKVIQENSEKLKKMLASVMSKHSSLSSDLDSTYITRLFEKSDVAIDCDQLRSQLQELQKKQSKLQNYGLTENNNALYLSGLTADKLKKYSVELSIYLDDATKKYKIFEDMIQKLDLYEQIVNEKLSFKKMMLSPSDGISVISDEGQALALDQLSSGEQEILVLFFELIFESDVNLLMIDEPEISLHIAWQKELMDNLRSIVKLNHNIQVIIATHSPQIISKNWDLQVDLGGQFNG